MDSQLLSAVYKAIHQEVGNDKCIEF